MDSSRKRRGETVMEIYNVGDIPFYYTILQKPLNPIDLPNKLCFMLKQDNNGLIRQHDSENEQKLLSLAYEKGSQISGLMDDEGIGKLYADDFIEFILKNDENIAGKRILEIGCGTGYLLYELQKLGADVQGIEPGNYGIQGREKYKVPIIIDFFDPKKITEKYDVIIFFGVLEHMINAGQFLKDVKSILNTDGNIFLAVPDCEPYILAGDISMLIHEHWNYFTKNTLKALISSLGLNGEIIRSEFAGALYACLTLGECENNTNIEYSLLSDYINKIEIQKKKFSVFIESIIANQVLGIYVPGRIINMLSICYEVIPEQIRFFDDNDNLHGMYYPGIDIEIENFEDFLDNPVEIVLIASYTFGEKIKDKILKSNVKCKVVLLEELFR